MNDEKIKEILIEKDDKFKKLFLEHQECEEKLSYLYDDYTNENEIKEVKKRKLFLKDLMKKDSYEYKSKNRF